MNVILDTNGYSELQVGNNQIKKVTLAADTIYISAASLGELYGGFKAGLKENLNIELLGYFLDGNKVRIAKIGKYTAMIYGDISLSLRKQGTPLPINDVWIAACAIETNSTLVTYDKHFLKIPGVKLWKYLK